MTWVILVVVSLSVCLIWELDERQTMKKYKKKKKTEQQRKK